MSDAPTFDDDGYLDMEGFDDVDPDALGEVGLEVRTAIDSLVDPPLPDDAWQAMLDQAVDADAPAAPLELLGDDPAGADDLVPGDGVALLDDVDDVDDLDAGDDPDPANWDEDLGSSDDALDEDVDLGELPDDPGDFDHGFDAG